MRTYIITGCSTVDSLGYKIAEHIMKMPENKDCIIVAIANENDYDNGILKCVDEVYTCDLTKDYSGAIETVKEYHPNIYALINCAGINGNYWFEDTTDENFYDIMDVNVKAIYKTSQCLLENISREKGAILNIVSNAARMPMRCSTFYNASKAAALMMTYQMARELTQKYDITVFSISPNKLKGTKMSKYVDAKIPEIRGWTEEQSEKYQSAGLTTGKETDPDTLAEFIAFVLSTKERHFYLSGCDLHYGS